MPPVLGGIPLFPREENSDKHSHFLTTPTTANTHRALSAKPVFLLDDIRNNDQLRTSKNPLLHKNSANIGPNGQDKLFQNSGN